MPVLAPGDADYACDFFVVVLTGVIINLAVLPEWEKSRCPRSVCPLSVMCCGKGVWLRDWAALAVALTLFFKMTSEGGTSHQMHHSLIKCCSLHRLMGLRADYAGLYIMSV